MSKETNKNIKIIIPSSIDDEDAHMLVIPQLREPVLMQDVYQPDQAIKLLRIKKPCLYEIIDLKQRNPLPLRNYGPVNRVLLHCGLSSEMMHGIRAGLPKDSTKVHKGCEKRRKQRSAKQILLKPVVRMAVSIIKILISQVVRYSIEWLLG